MKAIISTGNKQYLVQAGDLLDIEVIESDKKSVTFEPLLVINDKEVLVGTPVVAGHSVTAEVVGETRGDKVLSIRYKSKKRVHKVHGHRQHFTQIKITAVK